MSARSWARSMSFETVMVTECSGFRAQTCSPKSSLLSQVVPRAGARAPRRLPGGAIWLSSAGDCGTTRRVSGPPPARHRADASRKAGRRDSWRSRPASAASAATASSTPTWWRRAARSRSSTPARPGLWGRVAAELAAMGRAPRATCARSCSPMATATTSATRNGRAASVAGRSASTRSTRHWRAARCPNPVDGRWARRGSGPSCRSAGGRCDTALLRVPHLGEVATYGDGATLDVPGAAAGDPRAGAHARAARRSTSPATTRCSSATRWRPTRSRTARAGRGSRRSAADAALARAVARQPRGARGAARPARSRRRVRRAASTRRSASPARRRCRARGRPPAAGPAWGAA